MKRNRQKTPMRRIDDIHGSADDSTGKQNSNDTPPSLFFFSLCSIPCHYFLVLSWWLKNHKEKQHCHIFVFFCCFSPFLFVFSSCKERDKRESRKNHVTFNEDNTEKTKGECLRKAPHWRCRLFLLQKKKYFIKYFSFAIIIEEDCRWRTKVVR